jgi:hypothetical protein
MGKAAKSAKKANRGQTKAGVEELTDRGKSIRDAHPENRTDKTTQFCRSI